MSSFSQSDCRGLNCSRDLVNVLFTLKKDTARHVLFFSLDVLNEPVGSHPIVRHGIKDGNAQGMSLMVKLIRIRVSYGWHLKLSLCRKREEKLRLTLKLQPGKLEGRFILWWKMRGL